ncbi:MAG: ferredoxin III, nif-specific [Pseudomonadales bacterium]|jgi:Nif-specific ferredoxin III|uniref:ferredoxin III, nif-specific n=1 Tax=unclassified Ketobacter TaxID=2639109 RepID=UPI000C8C3644|nr:MULTISPECIES: ferredoxin III, nif-specific [unclassified Ketobacter]MAA58722.1 ferredoxin III, nif-specific [Pseudomonadales bacterium]MEC8811711.1 ferredoxin III, nif-specific [Pseudomonadota bacterium]TNC84539.1 MAG: ferredoxin III, nif-specific [Alcanivorax sp.]HAG94708.1 ferredoxin III, nif-specific [Gammaproteobacteria bacterium]MAQ26964.1 ferredoxin III, nif-specific [Pseudomonadales bacterium]
MTDNVIVGRTRGGAEWVPEFVTDLNASTCIGCGRCYKVCPRDVFELVDRGEEVDDDDDFYDDDDEMMVMSIKDAMDCIGCKSCAAVCPKKCHTHEAVAG